MKHTSLFRRLRLASPLFLAPLFVVACGGDAPPPAAAPAATVAKPAPAVAADTSAVPEPADLVVTARLTKPSQVENVVGGWTSLPMPGADDVADLVADLNVGAIIDLDAPIDVAVAVEGHAKRMKPVYAFALGVKAGANPQSLERVKTTSLGGGIFKLEAKRAHTGNGDDDDSDDGSTLCEIVPSAGPSANRLICGGSEGAVAQLGPYLARTAPRTTYPTDLHVEARLDPVRTTLQQARQFIPMLVGSMSDEMKNQAVSDLANAAIGDFVDAALDLDRVKLDVSLKEPAATATMSASFRETKSLIAQVMTAHPERADVPPPSFWHLPADSKSAIFGRGIDTNKLDHPRELIVNALTKVLDDKGVAADDRAAIADVVQQYLALFTSPSVFATGFDTPAGATATATPAAKDAKDKKPGAAPAAKPDREARAEENAKGAWSLLGIEQPIAKVGAFAKAVPTTLHRPGVQKLAKGSMAEGVPVPTIVSSPVSAKLGLPKDTQHVVVTVTMKSPDQPEPAMAQGMDNDVKGGKAVKPAKPVAKPKVKLEKPYVVHFYFVPDAGRTWIGYGADETIVASHIKTALSTGTDPAVLQSRAGLDDLKTAKVGSGGFLTLRGALSPSPLQPLFKGSEDRDVARLFGRLPNTPQKGETPMPFTVVASPPAGQGAGSTNITLKVPRETVKDIVAAALGRQ